MEIINIVAATVKHYSVAQHLLDPNNGIILQRYQDIQTIFTLPSELPGGPELLSLR
jgi:hypothetical protein